MPTVHASPARVHSTRTRRPVAPHPAALDGSAWADDDPYDLGPTAADDRWHAEQSTDHHFTGPTPVEILDGPDPDWDALAEESAALDRLCAGCLL